MSKKIRVRLGKAQSIVGFAVGCLFCFIGLFVVTPIFGLFGLIWTAIAGIITYSQGVYLFGNEAQSGFFGHEIIVDEEVMPKGKSHIERRLRDLQGLYDTGMITRDEYEEKRKEILKSL